MNDIYLLDCTLRDGGYTNKWHFGHNTMLNIVQHLVSSGADFIELGFLDERYPFDINCSIFPDTASANAIFGNIDKGGSMFLGMIDYGTCPLKNIMPASECIFDGIRVIFKKHIMNEAMAFCAELKKLGYKVFSQLVSITSYSDEEFMRLIELVNEVEPYAVSIVDTYGLLLPPELMHYDRMLEENVKPSVNIGFHAHNNFQMAYANDRAFLSAGERHDERNILVDGTLYGMGKSAGNAPIELLAMTLNREYGKNYNTEHMLEAIRTNILSCYSVSPWGYNWFFYMSAYNRCHPSYLSAFLDNDEDMTLTDLNMLLKEPQGDKKLLFDKTLAENIYGDFVSQSDDSADMKKLSELLLCGRPLLLLGPGRNIQLQSGIIKEHIEKNAPIVISINFIPGEFNVDYVFLTNNGRYVRLSESLYEVKNKSVKIIATSNVASSGRAFDFKIRQKPLLEEDTVTKDNSFLMLLKLLAKLGAKDVVCAGLDGYSSVESNYFNYNMEYSFLKSKADYFNTHVREVIDELSSELSVTFLTHSYYADDEDINSAAF